MAACLGEPTLPADHSLTDHIVKVVRATIRQRQDVMYLAIGKSVDVYELWMWAIW